MVEIYKLSMDPTLYKKIGLEVFLYSTKEKAVAAVDRALTNAEIEYSYEERDGIPEFKSTSGEELVSIVQ